MYRHRQFYDIYPKIVQENVPTTITVCPKNKARAFTAEAYFVALIPCSYQNIGFCREWEQIDQIKVTPQDGKLVFTYHFPRQQEYHVKIFPADETDKHLEKKPNILDLDALVKLRVYALEEEMYRRRPMVGDLHLHSSGSDGQENGAFMVAQYRKAGYDFLSLADHHTMTPSFELIEEFKELEMGLSLYPAEEVHPPENATHMLNFGGDYSVNDLYEQDSERYYKEVALLQQRLEPVIPEGVHPYRLCSCIWTAEQIRKAGGLAVLSHPMERWPLQYVNEDMLDWLLEHDTFDAMDVCINSVQATLRQLSRWNDARAKGSTISITGIDDCHCTVVSPAFKTGKTIVLAAENTRDGIVSAIRDGYNAVVHQVQGKPQGVGPYGVTCNPKPEEPHVYGTYAMVDYVQFLLEEYFPFHDEIAYTEGLRIHDYNNGDPTAAEDIARISRRAAALEAKYFGR